MTFFGQASPIEKPLFGKAVHKNCERLCQTSKAAAADDRASNPRNRRLPSPD